MPEQRKRRGCDAMRAERRACDDTLLYMRFLVVVEASSTTALMCWTKSIRRCKRSNASAVLGLTSSCLRSLIALEGVINVLSSTETLWRSGLRERMKKILSRKAKARKYRYKKGRAFATPRVLCVPCACVLILWPCASSGFAECVNSMSPESTQQTMHPGYLVVFELFHAPEGRWT